MKINVFLIFLCLAISGLSAFGFYIANDGEIYRILITVGAGLTLFLTLSGSLALSSHHRGTALNIRFVSSMFFIAFFIVHIVFSFLPELFSLYIIITGALFLLYILIFYLIAKAKT